MLGMQHWNGHQLCAIDCETGGLDSSWHELLQLAIVPLDNDFNVREDPGPFIIMIRPENPSRLEDEALAVNGFSVEELLTHGIDSEVALGMFERWYDRLKLPYTQYGNRKKIIPLGQKYHFDEGFISKWMGSDMYNSMFSQDFRDTKRAAVILNDMAAYRGLPVPYNKIGLSDLARKFNIVNKKAHDAYHDCLTTAQVYKNILRCGLPV